LRPAFDRTVEDQMEEINQAFAELFDAALADLDPINDIRADQVRDTGL
jgi:hypothetical protein